MTEKNDKQVFGRFLRTKNDQNRPRDPCEFFNESIQYDAHGNVTGITRRGMISSNSYGPMDNLTLSYDGNQLTGVSETVADHNYTGSFEYKRDKGSQYKYHGVGSLDHFSDLIKCK